MKNLFKPSDFAHWSTSVFDYTDAEEMANMANEKLQTLIDSWPVIYGAKDSNNRLSIWHTDKNLWNASATARLAFNEEIVKSLF